MDARAIPLVRTSPSGTPVARTKKPPTMASASPCSAQHVASGVGRAIRTTRTVVRAGWYEATWSVVPAPVGEPDAQRAQVARPVPRGGQRAQRSAGGTPHAAGSLTGPAASGVTPP
jgi:hypothetical protein